MSENTKFKVGDIVIPGPNAKELTKPRDGWDNRMDILIGKEGEVLRTNYIGSVKVRHEGQYTYWLWHPDCLTLAKTKTAQKTKASSQKKDKPLKAKKEIKIKDEFLNKMVTFNMCGISNKGKAILNINDSVYLILLGKEGHKDSSEYQYGKFIENYKLWWDDDIKPSKYLIKKYKGQYVLVVYKSNLKLSKEIEL